MVAEHLGEFGAKATVVASERNVLGGLANQQGVLMEKLAQQIAGGGQRGFIHDKKIKDLDTFNGDEDKWREWSMKLLAAVKEGDPDIHDLMNWAALEEGEIPEIDIHDAAPEHDGARSSTAIYNKLIYKLSGPAWSTHQSVPKENGYEILRLLNKRYNPLTPVRGLQLMLKVMNQLKAKKDAIC